MPEHGIYLFAVTVSDRFEEGLGIPALPSAYGDVEAIAVDGIVALVSDYRGPAISEIPQEDVVRHLMLHQLVVETAARRDFVLPVRLGTVVSDRAALTRLLRAGGDLIRDSWKKFSGHVEIDVAVTWDLDTVLQEVAVDPDVLAAKALAEEAGTEQQSLILDVGRLVAAKLEERRTEIARALLGALGPHVRDRQNNALVNDTLVANTAFLLGAEDLNAFDSALQTVDEDLEGKYNFRRVGPLPLYSFATVHVRELGQDRLDNARRLLGLPDTYDEDDVNQWFRSLAVVLHPDANPGDTDAADRFERLVHARDDLVVACRNRGSKSDCGPVLYFTVERSAGRA
ncbi:MAG: GvpL/GvpF family gas vesicle protein [Candidatus Nanopelagicales bacterium]